MISKFSKKLAGGPVVLLDLSSVADVALLTRTDWTVDSGHCFRGKIRPSITNIKTSFCQPVRDTRGPRWSVTSWLFFLFSSSPPPTLLWDSLGNCHQRCRAMWTNWSTWSVSRIKGVHLSLPLQLQLMNHQNPLIRGVSFFINLIPLIQLFISLLY